MKQYKKHSTNNTKHSKYKYTCYQNSRTYTHPHITKQVKTTTVKVKTTAVQVETTKVKVETTTVQDIPK
jgi:hypothetical protein